MTRFLFYVPALQEPIGGLNVIFEFVRKLRAEGFEAEAVSSSASFRYRFISPEPIIRFVPEMAEPASWRKRLLDWCRTFGATKRNEALRLTDDDIIVVPEFTADWLPQLLTQHRRVLLVQGYYVLANMSLTETWDAKAFSATVAVSDACHDMAAVMNLGPVHKVPLAIDAETFAFKGEKKKIIAYMPRRNIDDIRIVTGLLRDRGLVADHEMRPIDNLSRADVARIMQEASIFLSFSHREGFGLPPAEAMAAGCIVVGFDGVGGREFLDADTAYPIAQGDLMEFVRTVETVVARTRTSPEAIAAMRRRAAERIRQKYDQAVQTVELKRVFAALAEA